MQSLINQKIKFRESFRPFAPIVMKDHAAQYFEVTEAESPYMMFVAPVTSRSTEVDDEAGQPQNASASPIPAVTHVDGSARLQTVDAARNPLLYRLLQAFQNRTGCAVMINTSCNVRGEPIVCSPSDAIECFLMTDMEVLVLARHIVQKDLQDPLVLKQEAAERAIELDNAMDSKSHLMRPNWAPESKQLRWFGWLTLGVLLILTWRFSSHPTLSRILASVGILAACIGSFLPQALRPVYVGCMLLLMPIGWIVGELLMLLFYLGLLLPLSILFRLMGRDELSLRPGSEGTWRDRRQREPSSYYRQF